MANKNNNELEKRNQAFLIYQDENGIARVNVRFEGEDVWLNVEQMMELFDASQQDVSYPQKHEPLQSGYDYCCGVSCEVTGGHSFPSVGQLSLGFNRKNHCGTSKIGGELRCFQKKSVLLQKKQIIRQKL